MILVTTRKGSASDLSDRPLMTDEERRLFETEMRGVERLAPGRGRAVPDWDAAPSPAPTHSHAQPETTVLQIEVTGDRVSGRAFGVAHELLRDLATGRLAPEATLNLHHAPADSAVHRTQSFVALSLAQGRRCVLVIHGRGQHSGPGGPVLLKALLEALPKRPLANKILAVSTAPPQYGGSGALLLLLRKASNQK